eukprot:GSMAST32.ASY1.ANO1.813.1 assembled CDS
MQSTKEVETTDTVATQSTDSPMEVEYSPSMVLTHEIREAMESSDDTSLKLCILGQGAWKWAGSNDAKTFLTKAGIQFSSVKKIKNGNTAFIKFDSLATKDIAKEKMQGIKYKNSILKIVPAIQKQIKKTLKRRQVGADECAPKRKKLSSTVDECFKKYEIPSCIEDVVTPLWKMSYDEQLNLKQEESRKNMLRIARRLRVDVQRLLSINKDKKTVKSLPSYLYKNKGLVCALETIKASPDTKAYRNKVSFTIGWTNSKPVENTKNDISVGFRIGHYLHTTTVCSAENCSNIDKPSLIAAEAMQQFCSKMSKFSVYDKVKSSGVWRMMTVRHSNRTGQLMVVIEAATPLINENGDIVEKLKSLTKHFYTSSLAKLSALHIVESRGCSNASYNADRKILFGLSYYEEELLGLKFQIAPQAFFQVNTKAAEVLYETVKQFVKPDKNTVVVDVCCGTGSIGLSMAKDARHILGIDIQMLATWDKTPSSNNETTEINKTPSSNNETTEINKTTESSKLQIDELRCVAIVDPPRCGLHQNTIKAIRSCSAIQRLVYVSCNPSGSLLSNAVLLFEMRRFSCASIEQIVVKRKLERHTHSVELCRSARGKRDTIPGIPFYPVHAQPVDLFPSTDHCEMVMVFERNMESSEATFASSPEGIAQAQKAKLRAEKKAMHRARGKAEKAEKLRREAEEAEKLRREAEDVKSE